MAGQSNLNDIFNSYMTQKPIFVDKTTLLIQFTPLNIPHREEHIRHLGMIMAPILRGEKPSNVFVYGKTGTGKTLCVAHVLDVLGETATRNMNNKIKTIYINCKMRKVSDTEYRLLSQILSFFDVDIPCTGLPTDKLYRMFYEIMEKEKHNIILVLDEIDALVEKVGDGVLYNLTRINQEIKNSMITLVGISNKISFINEIDPRVKSTLSEEEMIFPPYNAMQLNDILTERVNLAFNGGAVSKSIIAKCSALAAQEHGDVRKALDLLRVSGEIAEREGRTNIEERDVIDAEKKLDKDKIMEIVKTQPKQSKAVLQSVVELVDKGAENIQTGDVYDLYIKKCKENFISELTQRRVTDLISELDMLGIINAKVISKGRYGRTREVSMNLSDSVMEKIRQHMKNEFI
ncbi:MAG: orc1/cdc6 family replication initiation protein [Candidatus Aenigmarchaeota archaeon]|nr:orc1/cdc6 family replication initiation protein [Candidatus Aenigmarchaeota archaeon]